MKNFAVAVVRTVQNCCYF